MITYETTSQDGITSTCITLKGLTYIFQERVRTGKYRIFNESRLVTTKNSRVDAPGWSIRASKEI